MGIQIQPWDMMGNSLWSSAHCKNPSWLDDGMMFPAGNLHLVHGFPSLAAATGLRNGRGIPYM